jgi:tryptophan synthase alpha chain
MSLEILQRALADGPPHLSAFLVLGDPDPERSVALAVAAVRAGSTMLELGLPYGDPCADGPAIAAASARARAAGVSTASAFALLARVRSACPRVPLNLLVYGNLVHAHGYAAFCAAAAACGASSLLVPDIPLEESRPLSQACAAARIGHVALVGPGTGDERVRALDRTCTAFLYVAGVQGVTGGAGDPEISSALVRRVAAAAAHPVCLGFGLSTPEHVRAAFAAGARIAVVGSHLARAIDRGCNDPAGVEACFTAALSPLAAAAQGARHGPSSRYPRT